MPMPITATTSAARAPRAAFGQYARTLGLADQDVVGPLQPQAGNPALPAAAAMASTTATPASSES